MKLTPQKKAARRAAFQAMSPAKKREHIWEYYKWPILLGLLALVILTSTLRRALTQKEPVVYLALVNISVGEELETQLTDGFLDSSGFDARKQEVFLYRDIYLTDNADTTNHQYAYASKMKLTGAISTKKLDLVLMNREAYDIVSERGYLLDLTASLAESEPDTGRQMIPFITKNEVILSDNTLEVLLGEAKEEEKVTESVSNALYVSTLPLFQSAGFDGDIYLGVIANSPRSDNILQFIHYLLKTN